MDYIDNYSIYTRRKTSSVMVGDIGIGSNFPIRIQSMTTTDTMDTKASVEQIIRMVDAGCEMVRLTAPSINEAQNLEVIKKALASQHIHVPLIADIHFTPNAAEVAARIVEKVRVNPGNYADKKKFEQIDYTESAYQEELERIRTKFIPLVKICKEYGTAMRIGTNHGSLSDRIMSRYGDSPHGMVESAMEFLRICRGENFENIVLSMKSSNPKVMVEAYRLLVKTMNENNMYYPLHLGVTEAGDGNDGRIKSALGIGALLEDGIGDTIRVSLTEDPEFEVPVAKKLVERYAKKQSTTIINNLTNGEISKVWQPFAFEKRETKEVNIVGGHHVPRVIADFRSHPALTMESLQQVGYTYEASTDKWHMGDQGCDFLFLGNKKVDFMLPTGLKAIYDAATWQLLSDKSNAYPYYNRNDFQSTKIFSTALNFLYLKYEEITEDVWQSLQSLENWVILIEPSADETVKELNQFFFQLLSRKIKLPVICVLHYSEADPEKVMLYSAIDAGTALINGFGDGILLSAPKMDLNHLNTVSFGILQAGRARVTKTEYISCPSCGRTLFDLQETTALIRKSTDHLKGVKIAIMGCIVNGPGEMADADYGYVGSGPGKITLYKGKDIVKKGVNKETAVDELIRIIKDDGNWIDTQV